MSLRKVLFVVFLLYSTLCWGQNKWTFKGIPLGISQDSFEHRLIQKGFVERSRGYFYGPFFQGDEYEYTARVSLMSTPYSNKVYWVFVLIPGDDLRWCWSSENGRFKKFVDLYMDKYGPERIYFTTNRDMANMTYNKQEVPYSSIGAIDGKKGGEYSITWKNGNIDVSLSLNVNPQYRRDAFKKKLLGFIPIGYEIVETYIGTEYSISISYSDFSIGRTESPGSVRDL